MDLFNVLSDLLAKHGPSGDEGEIAQAIVALATPLCDQVTIDVLGNVTAHKKGNGAKLMFSAHMDSIGFVVTHFQEDGFLRVANIGGITPLEVLYSTLTFKNGVKGVLVKEEEISLGKMKSTHLLVDIGAKSKEEAMEKVMAGDTAVISIPAVKLEGNSPSILAPYLDNRVSCGILLAVLELLQGKTLENDLYFVFSVQEEVGLRGAKPIAYAIDPDYALAIDVTDVCDVPESIHNGTCKLGEGAGIKIMDRSVICHPEVVALLEELASRHDIKAQRDILKAGGTDAGVIHTSRGGVKTGGISVPCRYIHTPTERADLGDIQACIDLATAICNHPLKKG